MFQFQKTKCFSTVFECLKYYVIQQSDRVKTPEIFNEALKKVKLYCYFKYYNISSTHSSKVYFLKSFGGNITFLHYSKVVGKYFGPRSLLPLLKLCGRGQTKHRIFFHENYVFFLNFFPVNVIQAPVHLQRKIFAKWVVTMGTCYLKHLFPSRIRYMAWSLKDLTKWLT